jgi:predicted NAD/FAD-binding protein
MGRGALSFTRRRWLQAACGASALAFTGGAAWWWQDAGRSKAGLEPGLDAWLDELAQHERAGWWDHQHPGGLARGHQLREALRTRSFGSPAAPTTARTRVLVIGGGIAGLSAAWALRDAGVVDVEVLELEDQLGGNSRGMTMAGGKLPCPMGAHYLPWPGPQAQEVQQLLEVFGLLRREGNTLRPTSLGERHLCHSPQERVYWQGHWFEGQVPELAGTQAQALHAQTQQLETWINRLGQRLAFAMPGARAGWTPEHAALESTTFAQALGEQGITHPVLRAHLDYCCLDDYGATSEQVSAWAGVHYFASRHSESAQAQALAPRSKEDHGVFTWPEGNAWLVQQFAARLGIRWHTGTAALSVRTLKHSVEVDALHWPQGAEAAPVPLRWQADRVVLATPLFISARLLQGEPRLQGALQEILPRMRWAPWLLTQLHLDAPLQDRGGAHPSWDNLIGQSRAPGPGARISLGYVDAGHQSMSPWPGPKVLTHYQALGGSNAAELHQARQALLQQPWQFWLRGVLREFLAPHPDLRERLQTASLVRHGHAMSVPLPGLRSHPALQALGHPGERVHLAHADLSAYSVFEEACYWGMRAGRWASA